MNYVVVDLEATCWPGRSSLTDMEIIEIRAVKLDGDSLQPMSDFDSFVRPAINTELSDFCRELTGIRQKQVDSEPHFGDALSDFSQWVGSTEFKLCSGGQFDYDMFLLECERHGVSMSSNLVEFINLKTRFAEVYSTKASIGLRGAMNKLGFVFEGRLHRGIDDARNIARVAQQLLILDG